MNVPTKQIIFIRHGVAEHNIRPADGCSLDLTSPTLFDPPLIYNGKQGALVAGEQIRHYLAAHKLGIELIVVSPLTRCIQTATLMFLPSTGPVVPMKIWPSVDFSMLEEDDLVWRPESRESWEDLRARSQDFLKWLVARPQSCIAVITHGVWLESLLDLPVGVRVHNGDAYACEVEIGPQESFRITKTSHVAGPNESAYRSEAKGLLQLSNRRQPYLYCSYCTVPQGQDQEFASIQKQPFRMRRSKSNPAKYAKNYKSISQRRMTQNSEDVDEAQIKELEATVANDSPLENILSPELMQEYGDDQDIVITKKRKRKREKSTVDLTPEERKQALLEHKKAKKKLDQLKERASQKQRRKKLYEKLQASSLNQETSDLLQSSATVGQRLSKRATLQQLLRKERAGVTLSQEEKNLLYRDRSGTAPVQQSVDRDEPENEAQHGETFTSSSTSHKDKNEGLNNMKTESKLDDGRPNQETKNEVKPEGQSFAELMMASMSTLKVKADSQESKRQETESSLASLASTNVTKKYVPSEPTVLQTAAAMGLPQSNQKRKRVREVSRPADVSAARYKLPVSAMEYEIMDSVASNDVVILCGETGSGKSTQVPQFLYEAGYSKSSCIIGVTQPRRVAAVSTAKRVCYEMGRGDGQRIQSKREVGNLVAYQTRYETAGLGKSTHIKFLTDGILLQEIQSDLLLRKYNVIVLDEAHERGLNTDVLIGLLSGAIPLRKEAAEETPSLPPLKLIIMSATLRVEDFTENELLFRKLKYGVMQVPGRTHPVTIHHKTVALRKVVKIHRKLPTGGILLFLTGKQEIVRMVDRLRQVLGATNEKPTKHQDVSKTSSENIKDLDDEEADAEFYNADWQDVVQAQSVECADIVAEQELEAVILPLYSMLSADDQAKVFRPLKENQRLIVVATNVAETSITIPGISYVVDSGRQKRRIYNATTGISSFEIDWISQAAADQRAGRSGRVGPGHCYRLYSSTMYAKHMEQFEKPEVLTRPLEDVVLAMKAMKIGDVTGFPFPTPPSPERVASAVKLLADIGCVNTSTVEFHGGDGLITKVGMEVSRIPLGARFAKVLYVASKTGVLDFAIAMVAALSEQSFLNSRLPQEMEQTDSTDENVVKKQVKKQRWMHSKSDALASLLGVGAYAYAVDQGNASEFCHEQGWNAELLARIERTRSHLCRLAKTVFSDVQSTATQTGGFNKKMKPPTARQETLLSQALLSGMLDHVALLAPVGAFQDVLNPRSAYRACSMGKDPLYMDRSSVLFQQDFCQLPKWVCFETVSSKTLRSSQTILVMKNLTSLEPSWIGIVARGSRLLQIGNPTLEKNPVYAHGCIMGYATTKFGGWEIPPTLVELTSKEKSLPNDTAHRWFARYLLDGTVIPAIAELPLNDKPTEITGKRPLSKVAILVSRLRDSNICTLRALCEKWKTDKLFLWKEMKLWIKKENQSEVRKLWEQVVKDMVKNA